jgi:hypothetical protein
MIMAVALLTLLPPVLVMLAVHDLVGMKKGQRPGKCTTIEKGLVCQP